MANKVKQMRAVDAYGAHVLQGPGVEPGDPDEPVEVRPGDEFPSNHPLVVGHPWAFESVPEPPKPASTKKGGD